jgi:hypothetical protein
LDVAATNGIDGIAVLPSGAAFTHARDVISIFMAVQALSRSLKPCQTRDAVVFEAKAAIHAQGGTVPPAMARMMAKVANGLSPTAPSVAPSEQEEDVSSSTNGSPAKKCLADDAAVAAADAQNLAAAAAAAI